MKLKCQKCSERATLHITEIDPDGNGYEELHLCPKCAHKYLNETEAATSPPSGLGGLTAEAAAADAVVSTIQCPVCKTSFAEFRSSGRLGCPHDYQVFREALRPLLESIHGSLRHIGKVPQHLPADARVQTQLIQLRQKLQQAIAVEDYEQAAHLRDQIETLENETQ